MASLCEITGTRMSTWEFKILYDGACPLCVREVRLLERLNRRGALAFEDISSPSLDASRYGVSREELLGVIHGVFPDGRVVRKMEVFRQAYSAVGLGWLTVPTGWPVLRSVFDWGYEWFARNRIAIGHLFGRRCESGTCQIPKPRR